MNKKGILGNLVGGFIVIIIGFTMFSTIAQEFGKVCKEQMNVSSVGNTLICSSSGDMGGLITIFFALGILVVVVQIMNNTLREMGLIGHYNEEDYVDQEEEEDDEEEEEEEDEEGEEEEDIITEDEIKEIVQEIDKKEEAKNEKEDRVVHKKW